MEQLAKYYFYNRSLTKEKKKELLKKVDVNYCVPDRLSDEERLSRKWAGYTSLHFAILEGDLDIAEELLDQGSDPTKQGTKDKCSPLHIAIKKKSVYKKSGRLQNDQFINKLLSKQIDMNNNFNPRCGYNTSHLHIASMVNHAEAVEFLAKTKLDLDQQINSDAKYLSGYTPLHCAIEFSSVEAAAILLRYGADIHAKNAEGLSCLHLLIKRILDLNDFIKMGKRTMCAHYEEEIKRLVIIVNTVLETRARHKIFIDDSGLSALHVSCISRDKSFLKDLLVQGGHVNLPIKSNSKLWPGWTPLHFAACFNIEMMVLLMGNGANILMKNLKGETALDLYAKRFYLSNIQLLFSMETELKDIVLSDNFTKLSDLLLIMKSFRKLSMFLSKSKDVDVFIPFDSPIWPGYNLLHLCVCLNEKTKLSKDLDKKFDLPATQDVSIERYNCTEDEEALFTDRINLCLKSGCSVDLKNADRQTPIHLAFGMHCEPALQNLLKSSKKNVIDRDGLSHLHIACVLGHTSLVKKYLSAGADVSSRTRISFNWHDNRHEIWSGIKKRMKIRAHSTPLHVAVVFGQEDVVQYLLSRNADVYAQDSLGFTSIHLIMYTDYQARDSILKMLFVATPNLQDRVSAIGLSHLHVAARLDNREIVDMLLHNGAEIERVIDTNVKHCPHLGYYAGKTPLLLATHNEKVNKSLLKAGANVYTKDLEGVSALEYALRCLTSVWSTDFVELAKSGKCDVESCGMTLLHIACSQFDIKWAKDLIRKGANVNAQISKGNSEGATPLHLLLKSALVIGSEEDLIALVKLLVKNGADLTIECDEETPLHYIYSEYSHFINVMGLSKDDMAYLLRVVDLLLKNLKSFDVNPVDSTGFSHFHYACVRNNVEVVTKFLDHGVDVNAFAKGIYKFTPLHFAMNNQSREVAYLLLEGGAVVNAEDVEGDTPLHLAIQERFVDLSLIETMISYGVDINANNWNDQTPFYYLFKYGGLTLERLEFFLNYDCPLDVIKNTDESHQGIIQMAMQTASPSELQAILEKLIKVPEMMNAIEGGFNIMHAIVAIHVEDDDPYNFYEDDVNYENDLTLDNYLDAITLFTNIGCDLDQQDVKGKTALHIAVSCCNLEAVDALLQLGADMNVTDIENECPLSDTIVTVSINKDIESLEMDIVTNLACYVWKMKFTGLTLKDSNLRCLSIVEEDYDIAGPLEQPCQDELTKAEETIICHGLTVKDYLSELGAVAQYPRMCFMKRVIVDKFFNCTDDLRREFPELSGILAFQYRKSLARLKMCQPTKEAIVLICQFELPDLCLEAIIRFLTNDEMKLLIENVKDIM